MALAARFARLCRPNDVIGLEGTLGAGKTCFVKGLGRGLGVSKSRRITSPTFVLLKEYEGAELTLHHFDACRLSGAEALVEIGCEEIFEDGGISVIEWADHVAECLPDEHFFWTVRVAGPSRRDFFLRGAGTQTRKRLPDVRAELSQWRAEC